MRRHLFLAIAMLLLASMEAAIACQRIGPVPTDEEQFAKADTVFVGHIFRVDEAGTSHDLAKEAKEKLDRKAELSFTEALAIRNRIETMAPSPLIEATFRVVEVLKGQPPADGKVRSAPIVFCVGAITAGRAYLFFLQLDNFVLLDPDAGTRGLFSWADADGEMERQQHALKKLRTLSKKETR